ncbi:sulfite reductase [NADPH] flavoprotein component [Dimargaris verticillata]|uniref:Sulfite reductase [NADPH] flavoprotein component n=1 Tax=Dimargaris verticillata TaxID=2761393 RepID=A0A9W8B6X4_9FUNG|nr:sulfite reductase [NADPH] flavoprotein component [Dimargaris verticillata]
MASAVSQATASPNFVIGWKLASRRVVVYGGDNAVTWSRVRFALHAGASVQVVTESPIADHALPTDLRTMVESRLHLAVAPFSADQLDGCAMVLVSVAAHQSALTTRSQVEQVRAATQARGLPFNAAEYPDLSDFAFMPIFHGASGQVQIAISVTNSPPFIASKLRDQVVAQLPPNLDQAIATIQALKDQIYASKVDDATRLQRIQRLHDLAEALSLVELATLPVEQLMAWVQEPANPVALPSLVQPIDVFKGPTGQVPLTMTPPASGHPSQSATELNSTASDTASETDSAYGNDCEQLSATAVVVHPQLAALRLTESPSQWLNGATGLAMPLYLQSDLGYTLLPLPNDTVGDALFKWASQGELNLAGQVPLLVTLELRAGVDAIIQAGLQDTAANVAVLLSSLSIAAVAPLFSFTEPRRQGALVFHIAEQNQNAQGHISGTSSSAVSHQAVLVAAAETANGLIIHATTAQEQHDMAALSQVLSQSTGQPVFHVFDGVQATTQWQAVSTLTEADLVQLEGHLSTPGTDHTPTDAVADFVAIATRFAKITGRAYSPVEYIGSPVASHVVITRGISAAVLRLLASQWPTVGFMVVRVYRPWPLDQLVQALPQSAHTMWVVEPADEDDLATNPSGPAASPLVLDVKATLYAAAAASRTPGRGPCSLSRVNTLPISTPVSQTQLTAALKLVAPEGSSLAVATPTWPALAIWSTEAEATLAMQLVVMEDAHCWAASGSAIAGKQDNALVPVIHAQHDAYAGHGLTLTTIALTNETAMDTSRIAYDCVVAWDLAALRYYDVTASLRPQGVLVLVEPTESGETQDSSADPLAGLDSHLRERLAALKARLVRLSPSTSGSLTWSQLAATWHQQLVRTGVLSPKVAEVFAAAQSLSTTHLASATALASVEVTPLDTKPEDTATILPASPLATTVRPSAAISANQLDRMDETWHHAARQLVFSEAFDSRLCVRPAVDNDETVEAASAPYAKIYSVTTTENKRLTPTQYDRNVFHLDFDITGTGLRYELGDALGVYGHNDEVQVLAFLAIYGTHPDHLVTVNLQKFVPAASLPEVATRDLDARQVLAIQAAQSNSSEVVYSETRTVLQWLTQILDLFGRPTKKFYEKLAAYATDLDERAKLAYLVSSQGSAEFKERVAQTVTYADVLEEFPSARPSMRTLITSGLIPGIKPRHYSIASSMRAHPTSVQLLVVLVEWQAPWLPFHQPATEDQAQRPRTGQCTRFLSQLRPGQHVTVSLKPSVMKLPPNHAQPVIMAGLGTGMAPFRAFIEERAYWRDQGNAVGPMVLYFGSRYRAMEYLYGEELEAYHRDGLLTHLRLAFSRDRKDGQKVYIQHLMKQDATTLHDFLLQETGHFYLCGPTWPAGDVKDAIVHSFEARGGLSRNAAVSALNKLKEAEQYILEVY